MTLSKQELEYLLNILLDQAVSILLYCNNNMYCILTVKHIGCESLTHLWQLYKRVYLYHILTRWFDFKNISSFGI